MPAQAKIVSIAARPLNVSNLCFPVGGVLASAPQLGAAVTAFTEDDRTHFEDHFGTESTQLPGRLEYGSVFIASLLNPQMRLRAEPVASALDAAIAARWNAYLSKYSPDSINAIITQANKSYSTDGFNLGAKSIRLAELKDLSDRQFTELRAAYQAASPDGQNRTQVVQSTTSLLHATGQTMQVDLQFPGDTYTEDGRFIGAPLPGPASAGEEEGGLDSGLRPGEFIAQHDVRPPNHGDDSYSSDSADQKISNYDYGYRHPDLENAAQYERAQISLIDEQFAQFMAELGLPNLAVILTNELACIDSNVFRLQVAYLNTFLLSPISGSVTGVYKNPGEYVRPGETVMRVEDNSIVLLIATIRYNALISIGPAPPASTPGASVSIWTSLFDAGPPPSSAGPPTITGTVVAARGLFDDTSWEIVVQCNNTDSSGNPILPIGYRFDYDNTTLQIG